ncbi:cytochrome P450 71A1-like isoform X2 [Oryza glaberrima]|uniref:cytochrome P450 71A1-like isoform X2 n=1 Tax=Oryza glaberrima TaxID=4538 RepID=UPI00224C266B|nr:cytochrome P450 71A1-like isoform X2 [Oryza glaberrima]
MAVSLLPAVLVLLAIVAPLLYLVLLPAVKYTTSNGAARWEDDDGGDGRRRRRLPPSPRGLPLLGHLHLLGALPHRALRSLAAAHGPVLLLRLGRVPAVVVSSAAAAEEVMRSRDLQFASRPRVAMAERLLYGGRDVAFAPYGEYWRQARRICVVHLLSARRVLSFHRVREEEAAALVARVRAAARAPGARGAVDLVEHLTAYSNTVVSRAVFGDESARGLYGDVDRGRALRKLFENFARLLGTEPMGELLPWLGWVDAVRGLDGKVQRTFEALDSIIEKVIDDHRRRRRRREVGRQMDSDDDGGGGGDHRDFVDVLLDVNETDKDAGIHLGTIEIKAIILDMFAAGTVTTTTAMEWAMAELITHREAMRKAQDEIREVVGVTGRVTEDHMDRLPYLKAMLKETLRLHPPNPLLVPHVPLADVEILDCTVPAHTRVFINAWTIGRDPTTWGEHAEKFMPERFLNNNLDYKGQDFELIPFGAGRRGCPGIRFVVPTIEMALASLLYYFDWEARPVDRRSKSGTSSLDMSEVNGISVRLKYGLPLMAKSYFS